MGEAPVNADGTWSFTPNPALADGEYKFTTVAVDEAGNRGLESDPYVLTIDTSAPIAGAVI
ncbi:Ig-like domain-containing protein, partial [Pseudomonas sp. TH31]|uniref:Ig-like domain-containing protein n=1 Tax=Pseudomonas sp. TH31 TaxID=2796396 RepID=UPI00406C80A3